MDKPELETLSYKPPSEAKENSTSIIEPKTKVENNEVAGQPLEQPKYDKCRYCGAGRVVRPSGEWQYYCECDEPDKRPSRNAMVLEQVDGCILKALQLLEQIEVYTTDRRGDKQGCIWTLEGWYKHNFKHLKKAFE